MLRFSSVTPQQLADLLMMEHRNEINQDQSKQAFEIALNDTRTPVQVMYRNSFIYATFNPIKLYLLPG